MNREDLAVELKSLEERLAAYEEKYGLSSKAFYTALMDGGLERYDEYDETRADFSQWKGIYETLQRRRRL